MLLQDQIINTIDNLKDIVINSSLSSLPDLSIKENSILYNVDNLLSIKSIYLENNATDKEKVITILDAIKDNITDKSNSKCLKELIDFCINIASGFKEAYSVINKDIKEVIENLTESIKKETNNRFKRNNLGNFLNDDLSITSDHLEFFDWDGIKSPSVILDILSKVSNTTKIIGNDINKVNFDIIVNDIVKHSQTFINIDKETISAIINTKNKKILSSEFIDIFINKDIYRKTFKTFQSELKDIKNIKDYIKNITLKSLEIKRFINSIPKYKDVITNTIYKDLENNSKIILHSVLCCQACAAFYKETLFKDSILINKTLINNPIFKKQKKNNITKDVLASYIRAFYLEKPVPMSGINISQINTSLIKNKLLEVNASLSSKKKIYRKQFLSTSFNKVMLDSFEDLYNTFNDKYVSIKKDQAFKEFKNKVHFYQDRLYGDFGSVEKAIYETIIEIYFEDTLIDHIYDIFSDKLSVLLDQKGEIDNDVITHLNLDVATDLITTFLKDNFITKD